MKKLIIILIFACLQTGLSKDAKITGNLIKKIDEKYTLSLDIQSNKEWLMKEVWIIWEIFSGGYVSNKVESFLLNKTISNITTHLEYSSKLADSILALPSEKIVLSLLFITKKTGNHGTFEAVIFRKDIDSFQEDKNSLYLKFKIPHHGPNTMKTKF